MDALLENVSRETIEHLRAFEDLVRKWTKKINLVSSGDISHIWDRHIVDSIQLHRLAPEEGSWLDIGSGGGFPGIVAAILSSEITPQRKFTLVDSDQRKCAFLRTAARELDLNVTVNADRVEKMEPMDTNVLSARAMTSLNGLLYHTELHVRSGGVALFPKGENWKAEHQVAQKNWKYDLEAVPSETNPKATVLIIRELTRA